MIGFKRESRLDEAAFALYTANIPKKKAFLCGTGKPSMEV